MPPLCVASPDFGYGPRGYHGAIPPDSDLLFTLTVISINDQYAAGFEPAHLVGAGTGQCGFVLSWSTPPCILELCAC